MKTLIAGMCILGAVVATGCVTKDMRVMDKGFECLDNDDLVKAEAYFNESLAINPDNPYAMLNLGVVYEKTGRNAEAKAMYSKLINSGSRDKAGKTTGDNSKSGMALIEMAKGNLVKMK